MPITFERMACLPTRLLGSIGINRYVGLRRKSSGLFVGKERATRQSPQVVLIWRFQRMAHASGNQRSKGARNKNYCNNQPLILALSVIYALTCRHTWHDLRATPCCGVAQSRVAPREATTPCSEPRRGLSTKTGWSFSKSDVGLMSITEADHGDASEQNGPDHSASHDNTASEDTQTGRMRRAG